MTNRALAIDPGSAKCGIALVERKGEQLEVLWRAIVKAEDLCDSIAEALAKGEFQMAIVGSGTKSQSTVAAIRDRFPGLGILIVDEKDTTLQARERYWEHHKRRGWRRIVPASMQLPPEPVDDFVAVILAERVLLA